MARSSFFMGPLMVCEGEKTIIHRSSVVRRHKGNPEISEAVRNTLYRHVLSVDASCTYHNCAHPKLRARRYFVEVGSAIISGPLCRVCMFSTMDAMSQNNGHVDDVPIYCVNVSESAKRTVSRTALCSENSERAVALDPSVRLF
jgi:hypothetical protein